MKTIKFEWDKEKNKLNKKKHEVTFEEAEDVFYDDFGIIIDDPDHSISEERFVIIGLSEEQRILIVCHCYREENEVIRIISARKATKAEKQQYYDQEVR